MPYKRKSLLTYNERYKRARNYGRAYKGMVNVLTGTTKKRPAPRVNKLVINRVNNLYRMIETKECTHKIESGLASDSRYMVSHNNIRLLAIEPFKLAQGAGDAMGEGVQVNRVGDRISIRGLMIKGQVECAQYRPKVYFRIMLIKAAKGDTITRDTLFKNNCANKMLD